MAASPELNHRQRRHVHMSSSIFSSDGPAPGSVYRQDRQQEVYQNLKSTLRENNRGAPDIHLPSPSDTRCTQNADHGLVIPGSRGMRDQHEDNVHTPRMHRTTGRDVLVHDGEAKAVMHANKRGDTEAIPKEFWATSVNLQWHDLRHEQCRQRTNNRTGLTAQEVKRQELSSEIFGKSRMTEASMNKLSARQELLPDTADHLKLDSMLHRNQGLIGGQGGDQDRHEDPRDRLYSNLANSTQNPMCSQTPPRRHEPVHEEDPANMQRRRGEKNFSDLFGCEMGERREVRGQREEFLGTGNCSFLDARGEIATRNKGHWRVEDGESAVARKQNETTSHLFDYRRPQKPEMEPEMERTLRNEGICWEVTGTMQSNSEIARRRRMKDHNGDFEDSAGATHFSRKQDLLDSAQVRMNMNASPPPQSSPMHNSRSARGSPVSSPPWATDPSAQDRKLASLQSSIFH